MGFKIIETCSRFMCTQLRAMRDGLTPEKIESLRRESLNNTQRSMSNIDKGHTGESLAEDVLTKPEKHIKPRT
jgi:hypothetical protein